MKKKSLTGKNLQFFLLETYKNCTLNEKFNPYMTVNQGIFFPKLGHFFPISEKG